MKNITLLGVLHGAPRHGRNAVILCGEKSDIFFKEFFPSFEEKHTLLIVEGSFRPKISTVDDSDYESNLKSVSQALYESEFGPDILYADDRFNVRNGDKVIAKFHTFADWSNGRVGVYHNPETSEEMIKYLTEEKFKNSGFGIIEKPTAGIKHLALEIFKMNDRMEKYMLSKAAEYSDQYEQIFIVTGAAHTFDMHALSNFPFRYLNEELSSSELVDVYGQMLLSKKIPAAIM